MGLVELATFFTRHVPPPPGPPLLALPFLQLSFPIPACPSFSTAGHLNDYNSGLSEAAKAEKAINHVVAPLDLAPYKALRWQRRRLVGGGASQQPVPVGGGAEAALGGGARPGGCIGAQLVQLDVLVTQQ